MQKPNHIRIKQLAIWLWSLFLLCFLMSLLSIFFIRINFLDLSGGFPSYRSLENPRNELSSLLYSADNVLLGSYFRKNRSQVSFDELSPELIKTLLWTEDARFYQHPGISFRDLIRVFIKTIILQQKDAGGGSTITQQLAKNLFQTRTDLNIGRLNDVPVLGVVIYKIKEMILAVELEKNFTKNEIFAMFLNTIELGGNTYGIKVASNTFFNKDPNELNYQESAVMVAMVNRPTWYNPQRNPERALVKRNQILKRISNYDIITARECDSLCTLPITLDYKADTHLEGLATYFRSYISSYLLHWCIENGHDLYEDGLRIYTTIDSRAQTHAEKALQDHMKILQKQFYEQWEGRNPWVDDNGIELRDYIDVVVKRTDRYKELVERYGAGSDSVRIILNTPVKMTVFTWDGDKDTIMSPIDSLKFFKKFLQAGFVSMDPRNGQIKAWVGGIDYRYFKYDHVKQSTRQPGSTFKPIVYTAVIASGYSPCYEVIDAPVTFSFQGQIPPSWTPPNANGVYTGERMTIRDAMAKSVNSITAYMIKEINPANVVLFGKRLGIESRLDPVPSLCLGTSDVSLYELCGAYSTFVNEGIYITPYFITRIEDKNGKILQEFPPRTREAISEETAYVMLHMLKGATEVSGGTAQGLSMDIRENNEIGAKTGTTNNASDGWFMGITHNLVSGAWVGGDDRSIHFKSWAHGQGARTAMPIWDAYMRSVYNDPTLGIEKGSFKQPRRKLSIELDCNKYKNMIQDSPDSLDMFVTPIDVDEGDIF
ncbi:MAG TPA: transglycosylase domain-containing protein [Cyclobacteriaceae bacterium]|nr:transglycosylase domain-containing protein [Cyclobacteriaceae bacterium]